jgi:hypothetical protein
MYIYELECWEVEILLQPTYTPGPGKQALHTSKGTQQQASGLWKSKPEKSCHLEIVSKNLRFVLSSRRDRMDGLVVGRNWNYCFVLDSEDGIGGF